MSHKPASWRHGRQTLVDERGVALIEFALVLPLLLLLVLGIVDFGKAFAYKNDETHLANQAARYAAVNSCSACGVQTINTFIKNEAETAELRNNMTVAVAFTGFGAKNHCIGSPIKVTLQYHYDFFKFLKIAPLGVMIGGSSSMRLEKDWGDSGGNYRSGIDKYTATGASSDPC